MIVPVHPLPINVPAPAAALSSEAAETIAALLLVLAERNEQDDREYQEPAIVGGTEGHANGL